MSADHRWWRRVLARITRAVHDPNSAEDYLHTAFLRLEAYRECKVAVIDLKDGKKGADMRMLASRHSFF